MTELKTLKDLGYEMIMVPDLDKAKGDKVCPQELPCVPMEHVELPALRAVAIKWVKALRATLKGQGDSFCLDCGKQIEHYDYTNHKCTELPTVLREGYEASDISAAADMLVHFFNLTEEDLR